jgi:spermidine/putrescine-binding protein
MDCQEELMSVVALHDENVAALPAPIAPTTADGKLLSEVDPELYKAWRIHISQGFVNNNTMFRRVLNAFLYPYWLTVALYVVLVLVGVGLFLMGVWLAIGRGEAMFGVISGGLGVAALLAFFVARPLQALEENLQFITWLGVIYNTYWSQLAVANDTTTVKQDLKEITQDTISQIKELQGQHALLSGGRFKLP